VTLKQGVGVVQGHWKLRRSIDHIRLSIGRPLQVAYSCMLCHFQVIWRWIIATLKRSLKVIKTDTIESLGAVSYSPSTVPIAYLLPFMRYSASKYSVTLKTGLGVVQDHWKWRRSMTFYWSAIVNIALSGTVFKLFDVKWYHDLEIWVKGHLKSFKWYHSKAWVRFPIRLP